MSHDIERRVGKMETVAKRPLVPRAAEHAVAEATSTFLAEAVSTVAATEHPLSWFWSKKDPPLFSHGIVLELVPNISATTLQNWANREIVAAMIHGGEIRGRRFYRADQLVSIAVGSKLVDQFGLSPTEAILCVIQANLQLMRSWMRDAIEDDRRIPARVESIADYWIIQGREKAESFAVKADQLGEIIKKQSNPLLVWHHGREMSDLAERAHARMRQERIAG